MRRTTTVLSAIVLLASLASAQVTEVLIVPPRSDGTVMAQTLGIKQSAGSAELGSVDLGPPGPPISGIQATWLEWNPDHIYAGIIGNTGTASYEVTLPPGGGGPPITGCIGAATLHGGWVLTSFGGIPSSVRPVVGSFVWTPTRLFLMSANGATSTVEVLRPTGGSLGGVQGVAVLHSYVWDYSTTPGIASPAIQASALVYTPGNVYLVQVTMSGPIGYGISEVFSPVGGPITATRGVTVLAGDIDTSFFPPIDVQSAALIWNPGHVFLFQKVPGPLITEVFDASGFPMSGCWGAMRMGSGTVNPIRAAGFIWQTSQASILTVDPAITVQRATQPPGSPIDPPLASGVNVPAAGSPLIERQASNLFEIMGSMTWAGPLRRALIVGQNQRSP